MDGVVVKVPKVLDSSGRRWGTLLTYLPLRSDVLEELTEALLSVPQSLRLGRRQEQEIRPWLRDDDLKKGGREAEKSQGCALSLSLSLSLFPSFLSARARTFFLAHHATSRSRIPLLPRNVRLSASKA